VERPLDARLTPQQRRLAGSAAARAGWTITHASALKAVHDGGAAEANVSRHMAAGVLAVL
jgi:hypothetical protein